MTCKNCGAEFPENENICPKCGAKCPVEYAVISAAGNERAIPRGFSAKKNIIIIIIAAILLIGGGITAIALTNNPSATSVLAEKLQLAERYLSEQNYEQAVIAFQQVLEIESMNVDAYLGLADAYIELGEKDNAENILKNGFENTSNNKIKKKLDNLIKQADSLTGYSYNEPAIIESSAFEDTSVVIPEHDIKPISNYVNLNFRGEYGCTDSGLSNTPNGSKGTYYAVKKVEGGVIELKKTDYPIYVSEDGYLVYYGYKTDDSVQVVIENSLGEVVSETIINGDPGDLYIGFGAYVDRLRSVFDGCDYAFYETDNGAYVFGKDGSIVYTGDLTPKLDFWTPNITRIGPLTYLYGYSEMGKFYYIPELKTVYEDQFPSYVTVNGETLYLYSTLNKNYGKYVLILYCESSYDDYISPLDLNYCYVIGDFSTGKITNAYQNIETEDGIIFTATDFSGKVVRIDANGNLVS